MTGSLWGTREYIPVGDLIRKSSGKSYHFAGTLNEVAQRKSRSQEIGEEIVQRNRQRLQNDLLDLVKLDYDERPSQRIFAQSFDLLNVLGQIVDLEKLDIWVTDNCTLDFGYRIDAGNQFIFDIGEDGVSGLVRIDGSDVLINHEPVDSEIIEQAVQHFISSLKISRN